MWLNVITFVFIQATGKLKLTSCRKKSHICYECECCVFCFRCRSPRRWFQLLWRIFLSARGLSCHWYLRHSSRSFSVVTCMSNSFAGSGQLAGRPGHKGVCLLYVFF